MAADGARTRCRPTIINKSRIKKMKRRLLDKITEPAGTGVRRMGVKTGGVARVPRRAW